MVEKVVCRGGGAIYFHHFPGKPCGQDVCIDRTLSFTQSERIEYTRNFTLLILE